MSNIPSEPLTRKEVIYNAILTGNVSNLPEPLTREEEYLEAIAKNGGGGGISTSTASASSLPEGSNPTVNTSITGTNIDFQFGIPKGDKGDRGDTAYIDDTEWAEIQERLGGE